MNGIKYLDFMVILKAKENMQGFYSIIKFSKIDENIKVLPWS